MDKSNTMNGSKYKIFKKTEKEDSNSTKLGKFSK